MEEEAHYKPHSKGLYVFISKDFSKVKMVWWDLTGYAMFYKIVPIGTFRIERNPRTKYSEITGVKVRELLARLPSGRQRKEK